MSVALEKGYLVPARLFPITAADEGNVQDPPTRLSPYYVKLIDEKKAPQVEEILVRMFHTGVSKRWLMDRLSESEPYRSMPLRENMDLIEILYICPQALLQRMLAMLRGADYDYASRNGADLEGNSGNEARASLLQDTAESLSFLLSLQVKGMSNLRYFVTGGTNKARPRLGIQDGTEPSDFAPGEAMIQEACLRVYLFIGVTPACRIQEMTEGTSLGDDIVSLVIPRLLEENLILGDFGRPEQLYFAPAFAKFLSRLAVDSRQATDLAPSDGMALVGMHVRCIANLMLQGLGSKELAGSHETKQPVMKFDTIQSLLSMDELAQSASRWLEVSATGTTNVEDNAFVEREIGWLYDRLGLEPPRIVIAHSYSEFVTRLAEEIGYLEKALRAIEASLVRPEGDGLPDQGNVTSDDIRLAIVERSVTFGVATRLALATGQGSNDQRIDEEVQRIMGLTGGHIQEMSPERLDEIRWRTRARLMAQRRQTAADMLRARNLGFGSPLDNQRLIDYYKRGLTVGASDGNPKINGVLARRIGWHLRRTRERVENPSASRRIIAGITLFELGGMDGFAEPDNRLACFHFLRALGFLTARDFGRYLQLLYDGGVFNIFLERQTAIVCIAPKKMSRDAQGRLHSTNAAAVQWNAPAGKGVNSDETVDSDEYFLHGVKFDKELWRSVANCELSCRQIISMRNIEQRLAALQLYGAERLLKGLRAKRVSKSKRGNELYELALDGALRPVRLLKYKDRSTDRVYVSFVPERFEDADEAMAWKFSLTKEEYASLEIET